MGNVSPVNLHPTEAVEQFAVRNRDELSQIHRHLADVVPTAFGLLESLHPDGRVHGAVLSAVVRDAFLVQLGQNGMRVGQLVGTEGQFRSIRFTDREYWRCRVHMHPRCLQTGKYLATTMLPETLLGPDVSNVGFDLAVLWKPSAKTKALRSAKLAAVAELEDRNATAIYASTPLPPIGMDSYWSPEVSEQSFDPGDDFDDFLPGEETGDDWS